MTIEKFYETLEAIVEFDREYSLQAGLETISTSLTNLVNAPAQPQHQASLAAAIAAFTEGVRKLSNDLTPALSEALAQIGGGAFFNSQIAAEVQASISANAMTPSVARDFVQKFSTQRSSFLVTVKQTLSGMKELGVENTALKAGKADLAFLIPRDLFENKLGSFAKELTFLNRLMKDFSEAITGTPEEIELETLSSSVPTVALVASLPVIAGVAKVVNMFLDGLEKVEKIRKIRADLEEMGIKKTTFNELTEEVTETVNRVVEESTVFILKDYRGDDGRKNELTNGVRGGAQRLFAQIERGLQVQFRAEPDEDADNGDQTALKAVDALSKTLHYPKVDGKPMLLSDGLILEGDIVAEQITRKTETTETKKATKKTVKPIT